MKDEKMKILEMLQDGKISAAEAANLMEQLSNRGNRPQMEYQNDDGIFTWIKDAIFNAGGYKSSIELTSNPVKNSIGALLLAGKNGSVNIEGYSGGHIKIHCQYTAKNPDTPITFQEGNGIHELRYDESAIKGMKISCQVPMIMIERLHATTSNGSIKLEDIHTGDIHAVTSNGGIKLEDVRAASAKLDTSNGSIKIEDGDVGNIFAGTSNGSIKMEGISDNPAEVRAIEAKTSNGGIVLELPRNIGVKLTAGTSNGKITCDLAEDIYGKISRTHIDGQNKLYQQQGSSINIELSTSNGSIKIKEAN